MKLRTSYVSNSSSSSYVIAGAYIGNIIDSKIDKSKIDFNHKNYICFGGSLSEGDDIIDLNEEMFNFIQSHKDDFMELDYFDGSLFECFRWSEDSFDLNIEELYNQGFRDIKIIGGTYDYNSSSNLEELKNNYEF